MNSIKASEKFWNLEERINSDKQNVGVVARMSRSNMYRNIAALLEDSVITLDDLNDFSEELQKGMAFVMRERKGNTNGNESNV